MMISCRSIYFFTVDYTLPGIARWVADRAMKILFLNLYLFFFGTIFHLLFNSQLFYSTKYFFFRWRTFFMCNSPDILVFLFARVLCWRKEYTILFNEMNMNKQACCMFAEVHFTSGTIDLNWSERKCDLFFCSSWVF